jgi:hypothetical protein
LILHSKYYMEAIIKTQSLCLVLTWPMGNIIFAALHPSLSDLSTYNETLRRT